jgi:ubiquinone/menaquinone biosynthesis C-methylase UbiE
MIENAEERDRYIFGQCADAAARLFGIRTAEEQAAFVMPHLQPGMSLLDCGCGPGTITAGLAKFVAPGEVVAFDIAEEQIHIARKHTEEMGITNVEFRVADIFDIPFPDGTFDAAYVNAVLEHLNEPVSALREIRRVLKPGGMVGVRDVDHGGDVIAPEEGPFVTHKDMLVEVWKSPRRGGDPMMGKHLRSLLRRGGFVRVEATASFDVYGNPDTLRVLMEASAEYILSPVYVEQVTSLGIADLQMLEETSKGMLHWIDDPDAFVAIPYCEAVGRKE